MIKENFQKLLDFFLPRICINCKSKILDNEKIICSNCFNLLQFASQERITLEYERKFTKENIVKDFKSAFIFADETPIQNIIHELKYNGKFFIGKYLGKKVSEILMEKINNWNADLIIAIPLHSLRRAERGFNQADIIAKEIGENLKINYGKNILVRTRFTNSQTKLNLVERKQNMKDVFKLKNQKLIENKNIILVDDVITTGATVSECARILTDNGAKNIFALSVAIAD